MGKRDDGCKAEHAITPVLQIISVTLLVISSEVYIKVSKSNFI